MMQVGSSERVDWASAESVKWASWAAGALTTIKEQIFAACGKSNAEGNFPAAIWTKLTSENGDLLSKEHFPENYVVRRKHNRSKRFLMYIRDEMLVALMDEECRVMLSLSGPLTVSLYNPAPPHDHLKNTLLDGRIHYSKSLKKRIFLIYDIIQFNGISMCHLKLHDRLLLIERIVNRRGQQLGDNSLKESLNIQREPPWVIRHKTDVEQLFHDSNFTISGLMFQNTQVTYKCELCPNWFVWDMELIQLNGLSKKKLYYFIDIACKGRGRKRSHSGENDEDEPPRQRRASGRDRCHICEGEYDKGFAVGSCDHAICLPCSAKRRTAYKDLTCSVCRQILPVMIYSQELPSYTLVKEMLENIPVDYDKSYVFSDPESERQYKVLAGAKCSVEDCNILFPNYWKLEDHMKEEHELSPCYLCEDDTRQADFLSNRRWIDRSSQEIFLEHLMMYHEMCYYCEFDLRKHNNWFPNKDKLLEHEASHVHEMGESQDSLDFDPHYANCGWRSWADDYKKYQEGMIEGDISNSVEFIARERIKDNQAFQDLPSNRVIAFGNCEATQDCHVCSELIIRETTIYDIDSDNKEYMRHLLSKHIMCFFCALYFNRPNVWFLSADEYNEHCKLHKTVSGGNLYNESFEKESYKWKQWEKRFVFKLKLLSSLFRRRYGEWRRVPLLESIYYLDYQDLHGMVDKCADALPETRFQVPIPGLCNVVVPCYLCVDDPNNTDGPLSDRSMEDRTTDEKNLRHLLKYHRMCYYCEFDCRKHNNWFPNDDQIKKHGRVHCREMGEVVDNVRTMDNNYIADTHYFDSYWLAWCRQYKRYQNRMIMGDTSMSNEFIKRELFIDKQAYENLPLARGFASMNKTCQVCQLCHKYIPRETTFIDRANHNREYMRHLLSEHIMCFFCARFQDRPNVWFQTKVNYDAHCRLHFREGTSLSKILYDPTYIKHMPYWKMLEREFIYQLRVSCSLFRRRYGGWRWVPLESAFYPDTSNVNAIKVLDGFPVSRYWDCVTKKHPFFDNFNRYVQNLVDRKIISKFIYFQPNSLQPNYDFDRSTN